jgi:hypothetical protein
MFGPVFERPNLVVIENSPAQWWLGVGLQPMFGLRADSKLLMDDAGIPGLLGEMAILKAKVEQLTKG